MSIESNDHRISNLPTNEELANHTRETVAPPREFQFGNKQEEQTSRPRNSRRLIGGVVAGLVVIGGAFGLGSRMSSGDNETGPEPTPPAATGDAVPGVENPVEQPDPAETVSPESPTETVPVIGAENFTEFSNPEIIDWYGIDLSAVNSAAPVYLRDFMMNHGTKPVQVDAAAWLETRDNDFGDYDVHVDDNIDQPKYFAQLETNLLNFGNIILANPNLFDGSTDPGFTRQVLVGATENFLHQSAIEGLECKTDCYDVVNDPLVSRFVEEMKQYPSGTVVTDVNLVGLYFDRQGTEEPAGTYINYTVRLESGDMDTKVYHLTPALPTFTELGGIEAFRRDGTLTTYDPYTDGSVAEAYFETR